MLFDGLTLLEQSKAINLTVDSGVAFPSNANAGEFFFLSTDSSLYLHDGTNWIKFLSIRDMVYDIVLSYPVDISPDEVIMLFSVPRAMTLKTTSSLYYAISLNTQGTASTFSIKKNGIEVGTFTFLAGAQTASFNFPADVTLAYGDYLTIVAPSASPQGRITVSMKALLT